MTFVKIVFQKKENYLMLTEATGLLKLFKNRLKIFILQFKELS